VEDFSDHREDGGWGQWLLSRKNNHQFSQSSFQHHDSKQTGRFAIAIIDGSLVWLVREMLKR